MSLAMQAKKFLNSDHIGDFAEVAGRPVHYIQCGSGEPLVLIHGVGQSLYTWREVFEPLGQRYHVFAPDLPGFGYSAKPEDVTYSIREQSDALIGFFDALGIRAAHILAFSSGAMFAMDFAQQHPDRMGELMVISPGGLTSEMPFLPHALSNPVLGKMMSRLYNLRSVRNLLKECFFDLTVLNEEIVGEYYRPLNDPPARRALYLSLRNFDEDEVMQKLRNLYCNTLIIWGDEDRLHPKAMAELFHAAIKNAQVSVVRNCGHIIQEEKPRKLLELIRSFLDGEAEVPGEP